MIGFIENEMQTRKRYVEIGIEQVEEVLASLKEMPTMFRANVLSMDEKIKTLQRLTSQLDEINMLNRLLNRMEDE
jgi:hypothetical protein